jgi:hypothetical protein
MMPFIQGIPKSLPKMYSAYADIISACFLEWGKKGYLTIDESIVKCGKAHRSNRAKAKRALHTEAGISPKTLKAGWGTGGWGKEHKVTLNANTEILLANNLDNSCAIWDKTHKNTSIDGDIGDVADLYPYEDAIFMKAGEVHRIGIFTPHESIPVEKDFKRQFLRIVGSGVNGREEYFTENPLVDF